MLKADHKLKKAMNSVVKGSMDNNASESEEETSQPLSLNDLPSLNKAQNNGHNISSQQVISLQRTIGNQATINFINQHRQQPVPHTVIQRDLNFDTSWAKGTFSFISGYDPATAKAELTVPFDDLKKFVEDLRKTIDASSSLESYDGALVKVEKFIKATEAKTITYKDKDNLKKEISDQTDTARTLQKEVDSTLARLKKAEEDRKQVEENKRKRAEAHKNLMDKQAEDKRLKEEAANLKLELEAKEKAEKERLTAEAWKRQEELNEKHRLEKEQKRRAAQQLKDEMARQEAEARLKEEERQKQEDARILAQKTENAFKDLDSTAATVKAGNKTVEARQILDDGHLPDLLVNYNTIYANANATYLVAKAAKTRSLETIEAAKKAILSLEKEANKVITNYLNDPAVRKAQIVKAADWLCSEKGKEQKILIADFRKAAEKFRLHESYDSKIKEKYQELYGTAAQKAHIATMKTPDQKIMVKTPASAYISKLLAKGMLRPLRIVKVYRTSSDPAPKYSIKVTLDGMTAHVLHAHMAGDHTVAGGPDPVHIKKTTGTSKEIDVASYQVKKADFATILPSKETIKAAKERSDLVD